MKDNETVISENRSLKHTLATLEAILVEDGIMDEAGNLKPRHVDRWTSIEDLPLMLTPKEVQAWLGMCSTTIYALLRSGEIPSIRVGRRVFVGRETLSAWCGKAVIR